MQNLVSETWANPMSNDQAALYRHQSRATAILRVIDIVVSLMALVTLLPLLVVLACVTYASDPGPILFGHQSHRS